jgi:acid phosphatase
MILNHHNNPLARLTSLALGVTTAAAILFSSLPFRALSAATPANNALTDIDHIIVIYQENWSFDGLYGNFPGANGIVNARNKSLAQKDRLTNRPLAFELGPDTYNNASRSIPIQNPPQPLNSTNMIDTNFPNDLYTLLPFQLFSYVDPSYITGDIVHRYWQEQLQVNHGNNDYFITWSDNPGLVMSHFDATNLPEGILAQEYTISDAFFHSAFGGSFLNHQFLIAAAPPVYPDAGTLNPTAVANLDLNGKLVLNDTTGKILHDGSITPTAADVQNGLSESNVSFTDPSQMFDQNYVVNTTFSVNFSPTFITWTGNTPPASLMPSLNNRNPGYNYFMPTIGDRLDRANVSWKWYSGGWNDAVASSPSNPTHYGNPGPNTVDPLFQWHHQAFAYYDRYAPFVSLEEYERHPDRYPDGLNPYSAARLQDEANFFTDVQNNTLPAVSFIKPLGENNEHPGYASLQQGQDHVASIVQAVQNNSDLWAHTAIIVTYDEHGGRWDHVTPPSRDIWGPGVRVPCIIISPFAPNGYVDHVPRDTSAILATIEQRFNLKPLNQRDAHATSFADLFSDMGIARSAYAIERSTQTITQQVTLTNLGRNAISHPVQLVLDNLTPGVSLLNASGVTADNSPYITVDAANLGPNGAVAVTLQFNIPSSGGIAYNARTAADTVAP